MSNTKGNKVRAIFNSVLDQLNEKDDKAVEGPVGTVQGQQVRATQLSSDYLAKRRANLDKKRKAEGKPVKRHVYAEPENASTQITYRDGIKALFESVLDELREGTGYEPEPEGAEDAYNHQARLAAEKDAKKKKQDAIDAEQAHHDSEKGKEAANQLRNLVHGRKGIKLQKPMINMGTSDKPKMKQLDWTQNIRTLFQNILSEAHDLPTEVARAGKGDSNALKVVNNHPDGPELLSAYNEKHASETAKGTPWAQAHHVAAGHVYSLHRSKKKI